MIYQSEFKGITPSPDSTRSVSDFAAHLKRKRGCVSLSFFMPFILVLVLYFDEALFADANMAQVFVPMILTPALAAGAAGLGLYTVIKFFRFRYFGGC